MTNTFLGKPPSHIREWLIENRSGQTEDPETGLRLTSLESGNRVSLNMNGTPGAVNVEYATKSDRTWRAYEIGTEIPLENGEWVEFRNDAGTFSTNVSNYYYFSMTGRTRASGSTAALLDYGTDPDTLPSGVFIYLFKDCATLVEAPELPATQLNSTCYAHMFLNCTSLTKPPALRAENLANQCYMGMFKGCTALVEAPELPAATLVSTCYSAMFEGCTSLEAAPVLHATTFASLCYNRMFYGCSSLDSLTYTANVVPKITYIGSWLTGVSESGVLRYTEPSVNPSSLALPEGWTAEYIGSDPV